MHITASHPFRILLASAESQSNLFANSIKSANPNTRLAIADNPRRLEELLSFHGFRLPHVIFLDLVDPISQVCEKFARIASCSIINSIPVIVFTSLVPPDIAVDAFSTSHVLYVRKRQTTDAMTMCIQGLLNLDWRRYLSEKTPVEVPKQKEKSPEHSPAYFDKYLLLN